MKLGFITSLYILGFITLIILILYYKMNTNTKILDQIKDCIIDEDGNKSNHDYIRCF